jgi:hypothetical protein
VSYSEEATGETWQHPATTDEPLLTPRLELVPVIADDAEELTEGQGIASEAAGAVVGWLERRRVATITAHIPTMMPPPWWRPGRACGQPASIAGTRASVSICGAGGSSDHQMRRLVRPAPLMGTVRLSSLCPGAPNQSAEGENGEHQRQPIHDQPALCGGPHSGTHKWQVR